MKMKRARALLTKKKVAVFIVLYNSERFIKQVIARIPPPLREKFTEIFIIDDSSSDRSFEEAKKAKKLFGLNNIRVLKTPYNRGYGGNQKLGYLYAIKKKYDVVVLLHGDGQYAPESLPDILAPFAEPDVDAVFGSRMMKRSNALKGGMPLYKWVGNIILTKLENFLLHTRLSEFHSGYRAYRVSALGDIPFTKNTDDFHFDTEIIIQLLAAGKKITEVIIPTYYGTEICHVNGIRYAWDCLVSVMQYKISRLGIFFEPKYDIALHQNERTDYTLKTSAHSIHRFILSREYDKNKRGVDLGAHEGLLSSFLAKKMKQVVSVDLELPPKSKPAVPRKMNLEKAFARPLGLASFDYAFALDVIEHLSDPDKAVQEIFKLLKPSGKLYASTGNIAFFITRMSLAAGMFNYGKKGILDLTHKRLFTIYSFRRLLEQNGFTVRKISYFAPPLLDYTKGGFVIRMTDFVLYRLAQVWPSLFAYQFLIEAERVDSIDEIYNRTFRG